MTCMTDAGTFRLLDAYVGWDPQSAHTVEGLVGTDDPDGVMLASTEPPGSVPAADLARLFGSPRLARGCGPCEWYLAAPRGRHRLRRRDRCSLAFEPLWPPHCAFPLVDPVAVAARRHDVAVSDAGAGRVLSWWSHGAGLRADFAFEDPGAIAFAASGELLVARAGSTELHRYSPSGEPAGIAHVHTHGAIERLAIAVDCAVWAAVSEAGGGVLLFRAAWPGGDFEPASLAQAQADLTPLPFVALAAGFCLEEPGVSGLDVRRCYSWTGACVDSVDVPLEADRVPRGQLLTRAIDSGVPGCRWHRVSVDADVPAGTAVNVAIAVSDDANPAAQGNPAVDPVWQQFQPGIPYPSDWQQPAGGLLDFLVDQPPGRYAFVRLRLTGQGPATPVVRRIRLDFPRVTSFAHLPGVYRQTPEAEDFGERFVSLFDASIDDLDRAIERHPALLDVAGVPDEVLPWLGRFFEIAAEPWWGADRYRPVLEAAPELYRHRGTPGALSEAIKLLFGADPAITERAQERPWGALRHDARVGGTRLFGLRTSRLRLGRSPLSSTPLRSVGNPDLDPLLADASRFTVLMPAGVLDSPAKADALRRLIAAQAPAHTVGGVRVGGTGLVVGRWSAVGIDTALAPLPAPVLGGDTDTAVRLSRASVLWSRHGSRPAIASDVNASVGLNTVVL